MRRAIFASLFCLAASCGPSQPAEEPPAVEPAPEASAPKEEPPAPAEEAKPEDKPHWGYDGAGAPDKWGSLAEENAACGTGKAQSPIDIAGAKKGKLPPLKLHYKAAEAPEVVNNGHTIQVNYPSGSFVEIGGKRFELLQFHFHAPSEHTVDGKPSDMVVHLVHKAEDGQLGVVAVLLNKGAKNKVLDPVWQVMPKVEGKATLEGKLDLMKLVPKDKKYYAYSGSLTTPPCTEGVSWNVIKKAATLSEEQIAAFKAIFHANARPVQPINDRVVSE